MRNRTLLFASLTQYTLCMLLSCFTMARGQEAGESPRDPGSAKKEAFPVTMDVTEVKRDGDGKQRITVTLTIRKGYHLYANPPGNADLESVKPILKVKGKNVAKVVSITYPKGEVVQDKVVGDYLIYTGTVKLMAVVQRRSQEGEPLVVTVHVQPFDRIGCQWPPTLLEKQVP